MINIHSTAQVQSLSIGDDSTIWQFVVILPGAVIGKNCNINCHVFIENDVIIGDNVTIKPGVQIWDGIKIGNDVFIGPNVSFTNDKYARSKKYPEKFLETLIEDGVTIGAGAVISGGIKVGRNAFIGAGSVVTKNIPADELWFGNPARFVRKIDDDDKIPRLK
jgi:UDP-2-acetamido-3-amino-2,3-dideoxy-glucuronate N-acetyltransferase